MGNSYTLTFFDYVQWNIVKQMKNCAFHTNFNNTTAVTNLFGIFLALPGNGN